MRMIAAIKTTTPTTIPAMHPASHPSSGSLPTKNKKKYRTLLLAQYCLEILIMNIIGVNEYF